MITQCDPGSYCRGESIPRSLLHDALERGSRVLRLHGKRGNGAQSARRPVQNVLATHFRLYLQSHILYSDCAGYNSGLFSDGRLYGDFPKCADPGRGLFLSLLLKPCKIS